MRRKILKVFFLMLICAWHEVAASNERVDTLQAVEIVARKPREVIPVQKLEGKELEKLNSNSVADALRYFSGVQVKDYGGVGGIKTVNVRSMGTNHTGVVYDGIELGNAQNGQIDLGQFSLDNMEAISLHNGQKSELLQPARDYGTAASIYMRTRSPKFAEGERYHARLAFRTGSFDLINPTALLELRISRKVSASLSAEWLKSSGKYKFRYKRVTSTGQTAYDTTATRKNGDIEALRLELGFDGTFAAGDWRVKAYHYNSERGVPGAIVNNVWKRGERVHDNNNFLQGQTAFSFGKFSSLNSLKYAYYNTHYINNDEKQIKIDNTYKQMEVYFSTANEYMVFPWWRFAVSYDFMWNSLDADTYDFVRPNRITNMIAAATSINKYGVKLQLSALGTFIHDSLHGKKSPDDKSVFTPSVYASWQPLGMQSPFSVRAFYKRSFRMPTFNDLYYAEMGNAALDPERVTQYNVGLLYDYARDGIVSALRLSADGYINKVKNKIVAYPKGQQFRWTMLNLGRVDITGIDLTALVSLTPVHIRREALRLTLRGQYTFQRAIDVTSPADSYYKNQIPYVPRHSGSAILNADWNGWGLNYSFIYVGERYNQPENIIYNYTQPWYTSDISLSRDQKIGRKLKLRIQLEINNIFNQDYEVIENYPMPKRNFRISLTADI